MKDSNIESMDCPLQATLSVIEGKYKLYIVFFLLGQTLRFSELQKLIPDATPKMLSQQLKALEAQGVVRRELYPMVPPKTEYSLTAQGETLAPIVQEMYKWGEAVFKSYNKTEHCKYHDLDRIQKVLDKLSRTK